MKRSAALAWTVAISLAVAVIAEAQPATRPGEHHPPGPAAPGAPGSTPGAHGPMPMMDMCRQMMAGQHQAGRPGMHEPMGPMMGMGSMMGPMMGMMGPDADPKKAGLFIEMRGEMMKAMGEVMMKYGQRMQGAAAR